MLEKPSLPDEKILACLRAEYGLPVASLTFLPLGVDPYAAVYRALGADGTLWFVKLRRGLFDDLAVALPAYLHAQGIPQIIAPIATRAGQLWVALDDFTLVLYPFVAGRDAYEQDLSDRQWLEFGAALKRIHTTTLPPALAARVPRESYSPRWRESVKAFQSLVEPETFAEPVAARLAAFLQSKRDEVAFLVERANQLGLALQSRPLDFVLCHSDMHAGNLLLTPGGDLYIVDWDNPTFAPKERDLALIGGSTIWHSARETALFYEGYGQAAVDPAALAYFRYERIIQDIAAFCEQLLQTDAGGADREQALRYLTSSFLPNHELALAIQSDHLLPPDLRAL
jgi:spectinomycin phosphotransferase